MTATLIEQAPTFSARTSELAEEYTQRLDSFVDDLVPPILMNDEYAARCSALLVALNREIARCAAAFGDANQVAPEEMVDLVFAQFSHNFRVARLALDGSAGQSVS
jgi:ABC-type transporter Mla subunit MlaD